MGWALNAEKCIPFLWLAVLIGKFTPFVFFLSIIFCQWMHLKAVGIASSFIVAVWCGIYGATILQMQKNALAFALRSHCVKCVFVQLTQVNASLHPSTNENTKCFLPWNYITAHLYTLIYMMHPCRSEWHSFYFWMYCIFCLSTSNERHSTGKVTGKTKKTWSLAEKPQFTAKIKIRSSTPLAQYDSIKISLSKSKWRKNIENCHCN